MTPHPRDQQSHTSMPLWGAPHVRMRSRAVGDALSPPPPPASAAPPSRSGADAKPPSAAPAASTRQTRRLGGGARRQHWPPARPRARIWPCIGPPSVQAAAQQNAEQNGLLGNSRTNAHLLGRLFGQQTPNRMSFCSALLLASLGMGPCM